MTIRNAGVDRFEQLDIEVKEPSVVLSVRLDAETARELMSIARVRGRRVSEMLREAVAAFAGAGGRDEPTFLVTHGPRDEAARFKPQLSVSIGTPRTASIGRGLHEGEADQQWQLHPFTSKAAARKKDIALPR